MLGQNSLDLCRCLREDKPFVGHSEPRPFFAPALSCLHLLTIPSEQFEDFADLFGRKRWNFLSKFKFIWHLQNAADKMQDSAHVSSHRDG